MVALDAGFDPGNLSRIETGRQNPSVPRLEAIARAMDVTVADLYALVEPPRTLVSIAGSGQPNARGRTLDNSEWVQLRYHFENLDAGHRRLALEFLQMLNKVQADEPAAAQAGAGVSYIGAARRGNGRAEVPVTDVPPGLQAADVACLPAEAAQAALGRV